MTPTLDQKIDGWAAMWTKVKPTQVSIILREAHRLGQTPFCLAGLIRHSKVGSADARSSSTV